MSATERSFVPHFSSITRLRRLDVLAEDVLARVAGEADEIEVGDVGALVLERGERVFEQLLLRASTGSDAGLG